MKKVFLLALIGLFTMSAATSANVKPPQDPAEDKGPIEILQGQHEDNAQAYFDMVEAATVWEVSHASDGYCKVTTSIGFIYYYYGPGYGEAVYWVPGNGSTAGVTKWNIGEQAARAACNKKNN